MGGGRRNVELLDLDLAGGPANLKTDRRSLLAECENGRVNSKRSPDRFVRSAANVDAIGLGKRDAVSVTAAGLAMMRPTTRDPIVRAVLDILVANTEITNVVAGAVAKLEATLADADAAVLPVAAGSWSAVSVAELRSFAKAFAQRAELSEIAVLAFAGVVEGLTEADPLAASSETLYAKLRDEYDKAKADEDRHDAQGRSMARRSADFSDMEAVRTVDAKWQPVFEAAGFPFPPPRRWKLHRGEPHAAPAPPGPKGEPTPPRAA